MSEKEQGMEVAGYLVDLPNEPELGHWLDEEAEEGEQICRHQPLVRQADAERVIDQLRAEVEDLKLQVQAARGTSLSSVQVADRLIYERDVLVAERDDARAEVEAMRKAQDARDLEMNAQGIESVIHCVVSKADQAVLRLHAREKRRAALAAKEGM